MRSKGSERGKGVAEEGRERALSSFSKECLSNTRETFSKLSPSEIYMFGGVGGEG